MTLYPNLRPWIPHPEATLIILHGAIDVATALLYWQAYRPRRRIDRDTAMSEIDKNETAQDLYYRASMILQEALTAGEVKATGHLAGGTSSLIAADDWVRLAKVSLWGDEFTFEDGRRVSDVLVCSDDLRRLLAGLLERLTGAPVSARKPLPTKRQTEATYKQWIAQHAGRKPPARDEDEKYMKAQCGIGRDETRRLRENLAPPDWKRTGPKPRG